LPPLQSKIEVGSMTNKDKPSALILYIIWTAVIAACLIGMWLG